MTEFEIRDPEFGPRVRASFARQNVMGLIGARLARVAPGAVDIEVQFRDDLTQQDGYLHGGIVAAVVDSACGYAAMTLTPAGAEILTVEYKINLMSPAAGDAFLAEGRVVRPGSKVTVCAGEMFSLSKAGRKLVATMLATLIPVTK